MKRTIANTAVILILLAGAACAQESGATGNAFGIGPRAGFYKSMNARSGGWYFGAQSRLRLASVVGLEASFEYRSNEIYDFGTYEGKTYSVDVSHIPLTVSALLFLPVGKASPYVLFGLGWYHTMVNYSNAFSSVAGLALTDDGTSRFGTHIGAGLDVWLGNSISLNADYRWLFLDTGIKGPRDVTLKNTDMDVRNSDGGAFTLGLNLYW